jgi:aminoglycoside 2''-phosphotransferase
MSTDRQAAYIRAILRKYPDFSIHSAHIASRGYSNDILIINDEFVFRFPRYVEGIKRLQIEAALLTDIQQRVTLSVPCISFDNLSAQKIGEAFIGYRFIAGKPLSPQRMNTMHDEQVLQMLAQQLAGFLKELHHIPIEEAIGYQLPIYDTIDECIEIYTRIRDKCFPFMRQDACEWATHHFESFLNNPHHFVYEPVLKHGNFCARHILYLPHEQMIAGILDFSSAGLGDPAYDFACLLDSYGESFLKRCLSTYPAIESFWSRILFYQETFALVAALVGLEHHDLRAFENGIKQYV